MKIRVGFVTNSSSSSYIILIKKEMLEEIPKGIHLLDKLMEFVFTAYNYGGQKPITNEQELIEHMLYMYDEFDTIEEMLADDGWEAERFKEFKNWLDQGYVVIRKDIDYNEEGITDFISSLDDGTGSIVVHQD